MFDDIAFILYELFTLSRELKLLCFILPKIKKTKDSRMKKKQIITSTLERLKINNAGTVNNEMQIKLKE